MGGASFLLSVKASGMNFLYGGGIRGECEWRALLLAMVFAFYLLAGAALAPNQQAGGEQMVASKLVASKLVDIPLPLQPSFLRGALSWGGRG